MKTQNLIFIALSCLLMISAVSSFEITAYVSYCQCPTWQQGSTYTGGQKVSYQGHHYQTNYWSLGDIPNALDQYAWDDQGNCNQVPHGTITNQGLNTVVAGGSITFNFVADSGQSNREIVADCCNHISTSISSYTFSNVQAYHCSWVYIQAPACTAAQTNVAHCSQYEPFTCDCASCDLGYKLSSGDCVLNTCGTISHCLSQNTITSQQIGQVSIDKFPNVQHFKQFFFSFAYFNCFFQSI